MSLARPASSSGAARVHSPGRRSMSALVAGDDILPPSSPRPPSARKAARRADESTSDALTSSGRGEISSGQLFVKLTPNDAQLASQALAGHPEQADQFARPPRSPRRPSPMHAETEPALHPPERPFAQTRKRTQSTGASGTRRPFLGFGLGRETSSEGEFERRNSRPRVLSLPRQAFRSPPSNSDSSEQSSPLTPGAFNDIPPVPLFSRRSRHHPRDSGITERSDGSSSLYPHSSSGTDTYPSLPSLPPNDMDVFVRTVDPEDNPHYHELNEMDADDVSYRLRLLMQNNYYLPPAHSKPYSEQFAPQTPKKSPIKTSSPTFLDIFKVGKRTKNATPTLKPPRVPAAPILRTTSDNSTVSALCRSPQRTVQQQQQHAAALQAQARQESKGRVVVVRERMDDIASAAKQVELDIKQRDAERREREREDASGASHTSETNPYGGIALIDPTDAVDLPPTAIRVNGYSLDPQASALTGLEASIGAAMLADRLPPSSPGVWSLDTEEEQWRKALLQEAVNHSLNGTPARDRSFSPAVGNSSSPYPPTRSTPPSPSPAPRPGTVEAPADATEAAAPAVPSASAAPTATTEAPADATATPRRKRELGQRIVSRIEDLDIEQASTLLAPPEAGEGSPGRRLQRQSSGGLGRANAIRASSAASYVPLRAETPTAPPHPLAPPPRRPGLSPVLSAAETPFVRELEDAIAAADLLEGGNTSPTSQLANAYEVDVGPDQLGMMTPPPSSQYDSLPRSAFMPASDPGGDSPNRMPSGSISSGSHYSEYSDQDNAGFHTPMDRTVSTFDLSRPSLTVSITPSSPTRSRRAPSEYSQPSPTTSAFRDAIDYDDSPRHSVIANTLGGSRNQSRVSHHSDGRYSMMSPPPRVSSSLAHINVLQPPPRIPRSVYGSAHGSSGSFMATQVEVRDDISERSITPPAAQQDVALGQLHPPLDLNLSEPSGRNSSPHSPLYPPSPISFFDAVEMQSQVDGDESSDDEDEVDNAAALAGYHSDIGSGMTMIDPLTNLPTRTPRGMGPLMRLRNLSTPHLPSPSHGSGSSPARSKKSLPTFESFEGRSAMIGASPRSPTSTRSTFSFGRKAGKARDLNPPMPSPPRKSESTFDRLKHKAVAVPLSPRRPATSSSQRPKTAGEASGSGSRGWRGEQSMQDQLSSRLDGMLLEHMERERDILRRITTTINKS